MFIGNFKNGFILLTFLFFYDILIIPGIFVILTVAKENDYSGEENNFSFLRLGNIIIPGIFVSFCLRFDILKTVNKVKLIEVIEDEKEGSGDTGGVVRFLNETAKPSGSLPKLSYFTAVVTGYLMAIIASYFIAASDDWQLVLFYLAPCCMVVVTACMKGEMDELWKFNENKFLFTDIDDECNH